MFQRICQRPQFCKTWSTKNEKKNPFADSVNRAGVQTTHSANMYFTKLSGQSNNVTGMSIPGRQMVLGVYDYNSAQCPIYLFYLLPHGKIVLLLLTPIRCLLWSVTIQGVGDWPDKRQCYLHKHRHKAPILSGGCSSGVKIHSLHCGFDPELVKP